MKIILDETLVNDTIKISPKRLFRCTCGAISTRKEVRKIGAKYFCRTCMKEVEEFTNTETGKNLMEIINL